MLNKTMLRAYGNAFGYLYLFYVIVKVEAERKKLVIKANEFDKLAVKHKALVRVFEKTFNLLSEEDQQKIMEAANIEMIFAQITEKLD